MAVIEEKIISELSKHQEPVKYSDLRKKFKEPNFLERFCFLITTGDIMVLGWAYEKSKHPEEAMRINKIHDQYTGESGGIRSDREHIRQYVEEIFKGPKSQPFEEMGDNEPVILYRPNLPGMMKRLK